MDQCYGLVRARERRAARRERKKQERLRERQSAAVKKARICETCGRWIRKVDLFYMGEPQGRAYIHMRTRDMVNWSPSRLEALLNHVAKPRIIPQRGE